MSSNVEHYLHTETPMLSAMREGVGGYQPMFRGKALATECGDYTISLANIRAIRNAGCHAVSMLAANGNVLFVFSTGEQYLATGFSIGHKNKEVFALAEIAAESLGGDVSDWRTHLTGLPTDWDGPLELPIMARELAVFAGHGADEEE